MNNIHRSHFALICDSVHATLHQGGETDLKGLHERCKGELTGDQVRSALDALRMDRRMTTRQEAGRTLYKAAAAPVARPTPKVEAPALTQKPAQGGSTKNPQGAKSGSAAPASRPIPPVGGAAQVPPKAADQAPKTERGAFTKLVLETLGKHGAMDRHQVAAATGRTAQHCSVLLSELKSRRLVKTDGRTPARFALPDHEFKPLADAAPSRRIPNLERKVAVLDRLSELMETSIAAELREIRNHLTGVGA